MILPVSIGAMLILFSNAQTAREGVFGRCMRKQRGLVPGAAEDGVDCGYEAGGEGEVDGGGERLVQGEEVENAEGLRVSRGLEGGGLEYRRSRGSGRGGLRRGQGGSRTRQRVGRGIQMARRRFGGLRESRIVRRGS